MDDVAHKLEHIVTCFPPEADGRGDEQLRFAINGKTKAVSLRIGHIRKSLVLGLPNVALDLIEIAAFVYAIDSSISRGGLMDQKMGAKWHRSFQVSLPVRNLALWSNPKLKQNLEETLMFLSGDRFTFDFTPMETEEAVPERYFEFGKESAWQADSVLMFSGGLDSYAGALEEIIDRKQKVALISHFSATKIAPIQRDLQKHMAEKLGPQMLMHFPMRVQLKSGTNKEGTHRARSFLFAALGMATEIAFGKKRVSFYENGVVSLNLPPVGNVLGTRATRTTHPQTLQRFGGLFSMIFGQDLRVDNPFFWRTKTDVVQTIARLGLADQIAFTRSCADVHNQTKQYAHCGRCSQCVDRRFAILAAGLAAHDPAEAYRLDLMASPRERVQDKEVALSYVRSAFAYEAINEAELVSQYPAILNAVESLGEPPDTALKRIVDLLKRHGSSVATVMRDEMSALRLDPVPANSLPDLHGTAQRGQFFTPQPINTEPHIESKELFELVIDKKRKVIWINDAVQVKGAGFNLLTVLAAEFLKSAGQGLDLLDYSLLSADKVATSMDSQDEAAVRQAISRTRNLLGNKFVSAGFNPEDGKALIESLPWKGYRLRPDLVQVRILANS
ncbi:MAG: 7-cyano-7-deazaguanine synthase [Sulfitobacter sp.]